MCLIFEVRDLNTPNTPGLSSALKFFLSLRKKLFFFFFNELKERERNLNTLPQSLGLWHSHNGGLGAVLHCLRLAPFEWVLVL